MKKDELFRDGVYTFRTLPGDILMAEWEKNEKRAIGLFSLKGQSGCVISPLPDGKYINLLSDMPVQAEGGMITIDGEPVVIMQQG